MTPRPPRLNPGQLPAGGGSPGPDGARPAGAGFPDRGGPRLDRPAYDSVNASCNSRAVQGPALQTGRSSTVSRAESRRDPAGGSTASWPPADPPESSLATDCEPERSRGGPLAEGGAAGKARRPAPARVPSQATRRDARSGVLHALVDGRSSDALGVAVSAVRTDGRTEMSSWLHRYGGSSGLRGRDVRDDILTASQVSVFFRRFRVTRCACHR